MRRRWPSPWRLTLLLGLAAVSETLGSSRAPFSDHTSTSRSSGRGRAAMGCGSGGSRWSASRKRERHCTLEVLRSLRAGGVGAAGGLTGSVRSSGGGGGGDCRSSSEDKATTAMAAEDHWVMAAAGGEEAGAAEFQQLASEGVTASTQIDGLGDGERGGIGGKESNRWTTDVGRGEQEAPAAAAAAAVEASEGAKGAVARAQRLRALSGGGRQRPVTLLSPKMRGVMKYTSFFLLVFQNSALTCTMRWSRIRRGTAGAGGAAAPLYATSTAVVCSEMVKLLVSALLLLQEQGSWGAFADTVRCELLGKPEEALKLLVPGLLYTVQNNLQYVASSNLEPAVFQVMYQVKMLTTATLSVTMLKKRLRTSQWAGVALLTVGLVLVQLSQGGLRMAGSSSGGSFGVGFSAVLTACTMAGFAGCYLERVLKNCTTSIWVRNLQLGLWGSLLGVASVAAKDGKAVLRDGFFHGYSPVVWAVVAIQAIGGLLISLVVRYGDALLKGFATGLAIIVTTAISVALFNFKVTPLYGGGASLVLVAILMYANILPTLWKKCTASLASSSSPSSSSSSSSSSLKPVDSQEEAAAAATATAATAAAGTTTTNSASSTASGGAGSTDGSAGAGGGEEGGGASGNTDGSGGSGGIGTDLDHDLDHDHDGEHQESAYPWSKVAGGGINGGSIVDADLEPQVRDSSSSSSSSAAIPQPSPTTPPADE